MPISDDSLPTSLPVLFNFFVTWAYGTMTFSSFQVLPSVCNYVLTSEIVELVSVTAPPPRPPHTLELTLGGQGFCLVCL